MAGGLDSVDNVTPIFEECASEVGLAAIAQQAAANYMKDTAPLSSDFAISDMVEYQESMIDEAVTYLEKNNRYVSDKPLSEQLSEADYSDMSVDVKPTIESMETVSRGVGKYMDCVVEENRSFIQTIKNAF